MANACGSFRAQTGIVAPAMTYEVDGEQYVSVAVGWGGAFALVFGEFVQAESLPNVSRVLTFKLGRRRQFARSSLEAQCGLQPTRANSRRWRDTPRVCSVPGHLHGVVMG